MQIVLTPDIEKVLNQWAQQAGYAPERLALELLRQQLEQWQATQSNNQDTLADFLADHLGSIRSSDHQPGGAHLSEKTGKRFVELIVQKRERDQ